MKPKDWFIFILLGGIWSSSFLWIKIALQEVSPITLVAFRVLFGLLFCVAVVLIQRALGTPDLHGLAAPARARHQQCGLCPSC